MAQSISGELPEFCPNDSAFMRYYRDCYACLLAKADDPRAVVKGYLEAYFSPYVEYCQEQNNSRIDPTWYTSTTAWTTVTFTNKNGPTDTATVLVDMTVLRAEWTGFQTATSNTITSSQPSTTASSNSGKPINDNKNSSHGPSPWVWAIVGAVVALAIIGLGILLFLFKRGKLRFGKRKTKLDKGSTTTTTTTTQSHTHANELDGDSAWRTGDKPELHGESRSMAPPAATAPKELYTQDNGPKELDSGVGPVELPADDIHMGGGGAKEAKGGYR